MASTESDRLQSLKPSSSFSLKKTQCLSWGFCLIFSLTEVLALSAGIFVTATSNFRISVLTPINITNIPFDLSFFPRYTLVGFRFEFLRPQQFPAALSLGLRKVPSSNGMPESRLFAFLLPLPCLTSALCRRAPKLVFHFPLPLVFHFFPHITGFGDPGTQGKAGTWLASRLRVGPLTSVQQLSTYSAGATNCCFMSN